MLNSHSQLAVVNDSHFIPRALEMTSKKLLRRAERSKKIRLNEELVYNVFAYHRFYRTGIEFKEFTELSANAKSYQKLVSRIFDRVAQRAGKSLAGEKTPDYLRRLTVLHGMFPSAKLIHLVRDGRNVALSLRNWATPKKGPGRIELWNENPLAVCALWWKWLIDEGLNQAANLPPNAYKEVQYERLTGEPVPTLVELFDFLELPFEDSVLEFNKGKQSEQPASVRQKRLARSANRVARLAPPYEVGRSRIVRSPRRRQLAKMRIRTRLRQHRV